MDRDTNSKLEKLIMDMLIQKNTKSTVYSKKHPKKDNPLPLSSSTIHEEVNLNQYLDSNIKKDEGGSLNSTIRIAINNKNTLSNSQLLE